MDDLCTERKEVEEETVHKVFYINGVTCIPSVSKVCTNCTLYIADIHSTSHRHFENTFEKVKSIIYYSCFQGSQRINFYVASNILKRLLVGGKIGWVEKPCYRWKTALMIMCGTRTQVLANSMVIANHCATLTYFDPCVPKQCYFWLVIQYSMPPFLHAGCWY